MTEMTETLHAHLRADLLKDAYLYETVLRYDVPLNLTLRLAKGKEDLTLAFGTVERLTIPTTQVSGPNCESPKFESLQYTKPNDHHVVITFRFRDGTPLSFDVVFRHVTLCLADQWGEEDEETSEPEVGQVSSEAAPSASPDEPST